jgi:ERCC4-type nuclease
MKFLACFRETALIDHLRMLALDVETSNLSEGDVHIVGSDSNSLVIFERKTVSDLASSLSDGRYNDQVFRLNCLPIPNHYIVFVIEGNTEEYTPFGRVTKEQIRAACISLVFCKGFTVHYTADVKSTAEYIASVAQKIGRTTTDITQPIVTKNTRARGPTPERMMAQISGCSTVSAHHIMDHYGSVSSLVHALEDNIDTLDNVRLNSGRRLTQTLRRNLQKALLGKK